VIAAARFVHEVPGWIQVAFDAGRITRQQAAAYKAWLTMRGKGYYNGKKLPHVEQHERSDERRAAQNPEHIEAVAQERPTNNQFRGVVVGYREAWGGREEEPVVQRLWYVQPLDKPQTKKNRVWLNTACWGLGHHVDTLPCVGERVQITVHGQIGSKVRASAWHTLGDPVSDVCGSPGQASQFLRIEPDVFGGKKLVFTIAHDSAVDGKTLAFGKGMPKGYLYSSAFMARFGTALLKRHEKRLTGIDHVEIGKARFDTSGQLHCSYGTAVPGEFWWHGHQVVYDLKLIHPDTGLFRDAADAVRFDGIMSRRAA
jgi:hypothetical protein